jgi:hypothetical protein
VNKPKRDPDIIISEWSFWFEEMIEKNYYSFPSPLILENGKFYYCITTNGNKFSFKDRQSQLQEAYKKYLIKKAIKDKLCE